VTLQIAYRACAKSLRQQQRQQFAIRRKSFAVETNIRFHRFGGGFSWTSGFSTLGHNSRSNATQAIGTETN